MGIFEQYKDRYEAHNEQGYRLIREKLSAQYNLSNETFTSSVGL